jgi:hypothetical protein
LHSPYLVSLQGSKDSYVTRVNVLMMQQVQECVELVNWFRWQQYVQTSSWGTKSKKKEEIDDIKKKVSKPLVHGEKMTSMNVSVKYGVAGEKSEVFNWEEKDYTKKGNNFYSREDKLQQNCCTMMEEDLMLEEMPQKAFMDGEALGCEPPRTCISCKGFKDLSFGTSQMTTQQAMELSMMKERITLGKRRVSYPFLQHPGVLVNNYKTVLRMTETSERRLDKKGLTGGANEVLYKMVTNVALVENFSSLVSRQK